MLRSFAYLPLFVLLFFAILPGTSYAQNCNGADGVSPVGGGLTQISNGDICSNIAVIGGQMRIDATNVNDGGAFNLIGFQIDWNDGSALQVVTFAAGQVTRPSANFYTSTVTHFFPPNGAAVKCEYTPTVRLMINGAACPGTLGIPPVFVRWNVDNQPSGVLSLTESNTGVQEYLVCKGTQTTVIFTDRSTLNCVPPAITTTINNRKRWRRYTYGTTNTMTSATGIQVNGVVQGYPFVGAMIEHPIFISGTNITPPTPVNTLAITIPADVQVGQVFDILMDYWDVCNRFDQGRAPVFTTARIRIVDQPVAPTPTNNIVCNGTTPLPNFQIAVAGTPTVFWYRDNAGVPGTLITQGTAKTLPPASYPGGITATSAGLYRVWASYQAVNNPDNKACESPKVPVTLTIVESIAQPGAIGGGTDFCNSQNVVFNVPGAAAGTTFGGATQYEWDANGGSGVTLNSTTATTATFNINIGGAFTTATRTIRVRRKYTTNHGGSGCPSAYTTLNITVFGQSLGGTAAGGGNFCQGSNVGNITLTGQRGTILRWEVSVNAGAFADSGLPTTSTISPGILANGAYVYRAVVANGPCAEANSTNVNITVSPPTTPASTGLDQNFCSVTLVSTGLGGSDPSPGTGAWTVVTKPPTSNVVFNSGTTARNTTITVDRVGVYTLRWTVTSGTCVTTDDINVEFGTDPGVQSAGTNTATCGTTFTLAGSTPTIGTGTWTLVTPPAGGTVSFSNVNSPTATATITGTPVFGAYTFRWSVVSGTCPARTANVVITFSRPATASVPANFSTCVDQSLLTAIPLTGANAGTVGGGSGAAQTGRWEIVSGTGTFTSNNAAPGQTKVGPSITDSYKPTLTDFNNGFVDLRVVALDPDVALPCANVNSATLRITFDRVPTNINAGPDQPLVCTSTATLAALLPVNGNVGTWTGPGGVTFNNLNDRNAIASNLPVGPTTLRWTVTSALSLCTAPFDEVIITRNALPTVNNLTPAVCEATPGGGSASNIILTTNDTNVTGGAANTTVAWFTDSGPAGPITPGTTPQNVANASPATLTFFTRVTNSVTTCQNTGTVTYIINPLPAAIDFPKSFCEDFPVGSNKVDNINLTAADIITGVTGGAASRVVTWFEDAAATTTPIALPTDYDIIGSKVVFARVRNTITNCEDVAQVDLIIKPRPVDQPLQGKAAVCVNALELYTISPVSGATYQWTIPGQFTKFLGGDPTDFLALISFPSIATGDIKVKITLNGCDGNEIVKSVAVSPTPSAFTINTPGAFICENEIGAPFSVTPNNFPSSNYNWEIDPPGGALIATGQTTGSVLINFLTSNVTIKVTESNASNCAGPPQQTVVLVRQRPTLADLTNTVCSGSPSGIVLDESATSAVPATTFNIISAAVDPGLIGSATSGNGVGPNAISGDIFENTTGVPLQVRYTVAPISADGCNGPSKTVTLTVNPEPLLDANLNVQRCSGEASGIILKVAVGSVPADQFIINSINANGLTAVAGNPVTGTFAAGVIADDAWLNLGTTPVLVTYEISPLNTFLNCAGDPPTDVVITVYPAPQVTPTTKIICSGDNLSLPLASNIAGTSFSWTVKSFSAGISGAQPGIGISINDILINNGATSGTVVYSVKAKNPSGMLSCEGPALDVSVTVNPAPSVVNITQTTCSDIAGGSTHTLDLTTLEASVNSGAGLTFTWFSDALLTTQITAPALNAYPLANNTPVYVRVSNGTCANVATVTFTVNPLPQVSASATLKAGGTGVTCNGSADGQIVAVGGPAGTSPFLYSINGGTNYFPTPTFNSLAPGTYTVTLKDNKNCVVNSAPVDITEPAVIVVSGTPTNANCKGTATGSIQVTASGGIAGTYTYSLNGGAFQTSNIFAGLTAGSYVVAVKDVNGPSCLKSASIVVGEPTAVAGAITLQTNVDCNGLATGSVTVLGSGGTGVHTYAIDGVNFQASGTFALLPAGNYTVTVKDANGCLFGLPVNITEPSVLNLNLSSKTDVNCNGALTGGMILSGSGGTAPYMYSIDNGGSFQVSGTFPNLASATYSTVVRDSKNCTATLSVTINQPPVLSGSITSQTNVLCNGGSTGAVTVNGAGGTGIYTFALDAGPFGPSGTFSGLTVGLYNVTVRDQNLCTFIVPVTITEPPVLTGSVVSQAQVLCNGGNGGSVEIAGVGGFGAYQYSINNGAIFVSTGVFNGLTAGNYKVIVRDANLCTFDVLFTITEPTLLTGSITNQVAVDCRGNATGEVTLTGAGGTLPYEYSTDGSNFQTSGTFTLLAAGSYLVRIRDGNGCLRNVNVTIVEPPSLIVTVQNQVNVDCNGNSTGTITLQAAGGVGGYMFSSDDVLYVASPTFPTLAAGPYTFFVRDANGCKDDMAVIITQPDLLVLNPVAQTNVLCAGQNSGSVTVQAVGGSGSYEYSKEAVGGFTPLNVFAGLIAGGYTIRVRDAQGCIATLPVTITEPPAISGLLTQTGNVSCFLGSDGQITVTAAGGNGAYTFLLLQDPSNVPAGNVFSNIRAGIYSVRITDANNCSFTTPTLVIGQPTQLKATATVTSNFNGYHLSCEGASDGVIQTAITGGTGPLFTYSISPDPNGVGSNTTGTFNNLPAGFYTVSVTDNNTCPATAIPVAINPPFPFSAGFVGFDQFICENADPAVIAEIVPPFGGTEDYIFQWQESSDGFTFNDILGANSAVFDPPVFAPFASEQVMHYKRIVTLASGGCGIAESNVVKITIHKLPTVAITPNPAVVCEGDVLFVNLTFTGQSPFRFDFTETNIFGSVPHNNQIGGANTPIPRFNYQETTTFKVTRVRDFNGCEITPAAVEVTVPVSKIDPSFTIISPPGQCSGSTFEFEWNADVDIEYTWQWNDGTAATVIPPGAAGVRTIQHIFDFPVTSGSTIIPVILKASNTVNGCGPKQAIREVTIFPTVIAIIRPVDNTICSGTTIDFENLSEGASNHRWYYRVKGTADEDNVLTTFNASYQFINNTTLNPLTYEVVYEGSNTDGCSDSEALDIIVYKNSIASFDEGVVPPFVGGSSTINFTNTSSIIDGAIFSYEWNFGTNALPADQPDNPGPIPPVVYSSAGTKKVTLVVTNKVEPGCRTTYTESIVIPVPPFSADFTASPLAGCLPLELVVNNVSGTADSFQWELRDDQNNTVSTSNLVNPTFTITQAGVYSLTLRAKLLATGQVADKTIENIEVYGHPIAAFFPRPKQFFVPDTPVDMVNDSQDANVFSWDFGDGETSIERDPTYNYQLEGKYTITLVAGFDHGDKDIDGDGVPDGVIVCYDTTTQEVVGREGGATKIPNAFTPSPFGPNGGFDDGQDNNNVFLPITTAGVLEFKMEIFDRWGNLVFQSLQKDQGWDGYDRNGHLLPAGVYVYKLILRLADGQRTTQIGDVTLIR